jgi:hypothetical protein
MKANSESPIALHCEESMRPFIQRTLTEMLPEGASRWLKHLSDSGYEIQVMVRESIDGLCDLRVMLMHQGMCVFATSEHFSGSERVSGDIQSVYDLFRFAETVGFPGKALVISNGRRSFSIGADWHELQKAFISLKAESAVCRAYLVSEVNPTGLSEAIARAFAEITTVWSPQQKITA